MGLFNRNKNKQDDGWTAHHEQFTPRTKYTITAPGGLKIEIDTFLHPEWRIFCKVQGLDMYVHGERWSLEATKSDALEAAAKLSALGATNRF